MPDHLPQQMADRHGAKRAAVHAVTVEAKKKNRTPVLFQALDALDQFAQARMAKDDHIPWPDAAEKNGDFRNQHKISILVERVKAASGDFEQL